MPSNWPLSGDAQGATVATARRWPPDLCSARVSSGRAARPYLLGHPRAHVGIGFACGHVDGHDDGEHRKQLASFRVKAGCLVGVLEVAVDGPRNAAAEAMRAL